MIMDVALPSILIAIPGTFLMELAFHATKGILSQMGFVSKVGKLDPRILGVEPGTGTIKDVSNVHNDGFLMLKGSVSPKVILVLLSILMEFALLAIKGIN